MLRKMLHHDPATPSKEIRTAVSTVMDSAEAARAAAKTVLIKTEIDEIERLYGQAGKPHKPS